MPAILNYQQCCSRIRIQKFFFERIPSLKPTLAPENGWLEDYFHFRKSLVLRGELFFSGSVSHLTENDEGLEDVYKLFQLQLFGWCFSWSHFSQLPPRLSVGIPLQATRSSTVEGDPSHTRSLVKTNAKEYQSIAYSLKTSKYDNGKSPFLIEDTQYMFNLLGFSARHVSFWGCTIYGSLEVKFVSLDPWTWGIQSPYVRGWWFGVYNHRNETQSI